MDLKGDLSITEREYLEKMERERMEMYAGGLYGAYEKQVAILMMSTEKIDKLHFMSESSDVNGESHITSYSAS